MCLTWYRDDDDGEEDNNEDNDENKDDNNKHRKNCECCPVSLLIVR